MPTYIHMYIHTERYIQIVHGYMSVAGDEAGWLCVRGGGLVDGDCS